MRGARRGWIVLGLALAACERGDPVLGLLDELEDAVEARDADAVRERLSAGFRTASGSDRDQIHGTLKRLMLAYQEVSLEVLDVVVEREGAAAARISCAVEFAGRARPIGGLGGLLPPGALYRFELDAADEAGSWRVTRAAWQPIQPSLE